MGQGAGCRHGGIVVELYPEPVTNAEGMLDVGDGNLVHWWESGNPAGLPAVMVHGGPGSGCPKGMGRAFDPAKYRVISFDQRGCGGSTPHASDPSADLGVNTTEHLIADMELLRQARGVSRWLLYGGSWGTTLGLAYAQRYPDRVVAIIMQAISTTSHREIDWLYEGVGRFFPREWARFRAHVSGPLLPGYVQLLDDPSPAVRTAATAEWCRWENTVLSLESNKGNPRDGAMTAGDLAFVRICTWYYSNYGWLEDGVLIRRAGLLAGIPGVLIHGRLDLSCPTETAVGLADAWPGADLVLLDDTGHRGSASKREALVRATDRFADLR
jgi:proline iminopeptidase